MSQGAKTAGTLSDSSTFRQFLTMYKCAWSVRSFHKRVKLNGDSSRGNSIDVKCSSVWFLFPCCFVSRCKVAVPFSAGPCSCSACKHHELRHIAKAESTETDQNCDSALRSFHLPHVVSVQTRYFLPSCTYMSGLLESFKIDGGSISGVLHVV